MKRQGLEALFTGRTGLLLDPYFSGTKLAWLLENVDGARARAERGELCFGTIDTFLIYRLTGGRSFATDATNASRTLMYDIGANAWDDELLSILNVPRAMLPEVFDCAADFGVSEREHLGAAVPILGVAGDQQAATIGQACFEPGMMKSTYGTGCFALLNTGADMVRSKNRLLTTIAYRLNGETTFALEGSIFIAGAAVQWLRDGLKMISAAPEASDLAAKADPMQDVYLVPAFTGLGAPHWDQYARGTITGLTRGTTAAHLARAALDGIAFQVADVLEVMKQDSGVEINELRVDGGACANDMLMQFQADILQVPVARPKVIETTALGAAYLAGLAVGFWKDRAEVARAWQVGRTFEPILSADEAAHRRKRWRQALNRAREWEERTA